MNISFLEPWEEGTGTIVISDVPEQVLQKLTGDFIITTIPTPGGHKNPAYALRHSDEPDDCSDDDFKQIIAEYRATVV